MAPQQIYEMLLFLDTTTPVSSAEETTPDVQTTIKMINNQTAVDVTINEDISMEITTSTTTNSFTHILPTSTPLTAERVELIAVIGQS